MTTTYTQEMILTKIEQAAQDLSSFYRQPFVNYRGRTSDTSEFYTELTAKWCINHLSQFDQIPQITREAPYRNEGRDGSLNNTDSNRIEEHIAKALYQQGSVPIIGKVLDYQTPLKNRRSDHVGKIDLLGYDGKVLRLLELKAPDSKDTMLHCILEAFTYLRTVNQVKLLEDLRLPLDTKVLACPLVFIDSLQYRDIQEDNPQVKQLAEILNSYPIYIRQLEGGKFDVTYR